MFESLFVCLFVVVILGVGCCACFGGVGGGGCLSDKSELERKSYG